MMKQIFIKTFAILLTVSLFAPPALLVSPQRTHALFGFGVGGIVFDPINLVENAITAVQSVLSVIEEVLIEVHAWTSAVADVANYVNQYVLQPIAFIKSGGLMKAMTAGVLAFINGTANGTGQRQFVQNLQGNLQRVGDTQAVAFFAQFGRNSNSPFKASIISSLRANYLQNTSAAGFWAANRDTLGQFTNGNPNAFLAGNWSQGGVAAWFALTTQRQNNPYMLYAASQSQLANVVSGAQAARSATLSWGQGFLSWCGPTDANGNAKSSNPDPGAGPDGAVCDYSNAGSADGTWIGGHCILHGSVGANPGDPCTQSDGTPGSTKTPASVITAGLNKVLGAGQDKLNTVGNIGTQLAGIMKDIGNIMGTINMARDVLRGPGDNGLAGAGNADSFRRGINTEAQTSVYTSNSSDTSTIFSHGNAGAGALPVPPPTPHPDPGATPPVYTPVTVSPTAYSGNCNGASYTFTVSGGAPPYAVSTTLGTANPWTISTSVGGTTIDGIGAFVGDVTITFSDTSSPVQSTQAIITCTPPMQP